ncbi:MAG: hypothetical protein POELPBGB_03611 [Bacteroidia bacterium]|nr:hypothetical protein [Bacteroidia bacterium]
MKHITILLLFNFTFLIFNSSAQSVGAVTATWQYTNPDQALLDTMEAGLLQLEEKDITATVTLASNENISKITVLLGSSEGSNDVFYKEFTFGSNGTFSDGTSYSSSGNTITLGLGKFRGRPQYYIGAGVIKTDGSIEQGASNLIQ